MNLRLLYRPIGTKKTLTLPLRLLLFGLFCAVILLAGAIMTLLIAPIMVVACFLDLLQQCLYKWAFDDDEQCEAIMAALEGRVHQPNPLPSFLNWFE